MEQWKIIKEYPQYKISEYGDIVRIDTGYMLKQNADKDGYFRISLSNNGIKTITSIHRLVAKTFIDNPYDKPQVNHIDGIKINNYYKNLEWNTAKENTVHAYETGLNSLSNSLCLHDIINDIKTNYRSIQLLSTVLKIDAKIITASARLSNRYPFMGRYVITLNNLSDLNDNLNSKNFGTTVHVFDAVSDKLTTYNSIGLATFFTGIRNIGKTKNSFLNTIGYHISIGTIDEYHYTDFNIKDISENREKYLSRIYIPNKIKCVIFDYLTKEEKHFNTKIECVEFLNTVKNIKCTLIDIFGRRCSISNNIILFGGIGTQRYHNDEDITEWVGISKEQYYNSIMFKPINFKVYSIKHINKIDIIYGIVDLLKEVMIYFKPDDKLIKRKISNITVDEINKSIINPNIIIERLNKIMI